MKTTRRTARPSAAPSVTPGEVSWTWPGIRVTSDRFTVGRHTYPIAELTDLRTTRGPADPLTARAVVLTAAMIGGVAVLLGFTGGLQRLTAGAYLTLGVVGLLPLVLALAGRRWRPPPYELWGRHRGVDVLLFSSDDERQFGQVARAVRRAREAAVHGGWADPPAPVDPWRPSR